jgi:hypothetical protein
MEIEMLFDLGQKKFLSTAWSIADSEKFLWRNAASVGRTTAGVTWQWS